MLRPRQSQQSQQARNKANTGKNSCKVERYLTEVERAHGCAKSWAMRERFERGDITLNDILRR